MASFTILSPLPAPNRAYGIDMTGAVMSTNNTPQEIYF